MTDLDPSPILVQSKGDEMIDANDTLEEILELISENRELRSRVIRLQDDYDREKHLVQEVCRFGETIDPDFRSKCATVVNPWKSTGSTWDFTKIVSRGLEDPKGIKYGDDDA